MTAIADNVLLFVRTLRSAGVAVSAGAAPDAMRALMFVGVRRRADVRDALKAVLVSRHEDLDRFDRLFDLFWRTHDRRSDASRPRPMEVPRRTVTNVQWVVSSGGPPTADRGEGRQTDASLRTYSAGHVWSEKDFADYTADDVARARVTLERLRWSPGARVTRRWVSGKGAAIDLRRVLRASARTGELLAVPRRARRLAPRPLVILCDVSGSMEPYARMLLLFLHALARRQRPIELFVFSTRLTRVTRQFTRWPIDAALSRAHDAARDWAGGTRIGDALGAFTREWGRRVLRRAPVVLIISDGWDLGDPAVLAGEAARLRRSCWRLMWLNPLVGSPGYEPLTRGMRAALPHVDDFLSIRNMSSLEALAARLDALPARRPPRVRPMPWT